MNWIAMKITNPARYAKLDAAYRRTHKGVIRRRARIWNRDNKARRNAQRRLRYAQLKGEL